MRMNICSCLLALVLGCNVTAEIIHQIVEERNWVVLRCSHSVEGKVTWSREINGNTVDMFIVNGDGEKRLNDPHKRYGSTVDKSLVISRANVSDSGKYLCNNEAAVELTVIPSGTTTVSIAEKSSVTLTCPDGGLHVPTWTREIDGKQQQIRRHVSAVHKYLNIPDVQPGDSGLYYCDGKPAAYLNVSKGDQSERDDNEEPTSPTTTSTTSPPAANTGQKSSLGLVVGIVVSFLLVLIIIITVYCARRCKRRGVESSGGPSAEHCLMTFSGVESSGGPSAEHCLMTFSGVESSGGPSAEHCLMTFSDAPFL